MTDNDNNDIRAEQLRKALLQARVKHLHQFNQQTSKEVLRDKEKEREETNKYYEEHPSLDNQDLLSNRKKEHKEKFKIPIWTCSTTKSTIEEKDLTELPNQLLEPNEIRKWLLDHRNQNPPIILKTYKITNAKGQGKQDLEFKEGERITSLGEFPLLLGKSGIHSCFRPLDCFQRTHHIPPTGRRLFIMGVPLTFLIPTNSIACCTNDIHTVREVKDPNEKNKLLSGTVVTPFHKYEWLNGDLIADYCLEFNFATGKPLMLKRKICNSPAVVEETLELVESKQILQKLN